MSGHVMSDAEFWYYHLSVDQQEFIDTQTEKLGHMTWNQKINWAFSNAGNLRVHPLWPETKMKTV